MLVNEFSESVGPEISENTYIVAKVRYNVYFCILVIVFVSGVISIFVISLAAYFLEHKNVNTITAANNTSQYNTYITGDYTVISANSTQKIIQFLEAGTIQFVETVTCSVLVVGGGGGIGWGGGGLSGGSGTGGGGGGGVGEGMLTFYGGEKYTIDIGKGGIAGHNYGGNNGGHTIVKGKGIAEYAHGGGMGGYYIHSSHAGGSSGGNYGFNGYLTHNPTHYTFLFNNTIPGKATRGNGTLNYHGNVGGYGIVDNNLNSGSGGGGAGSKGKMANLDGQGGDGGDGYLWSVTQQYYGGGGGGGGCSSCIGGIGGRGGGNGGSNVVSATRPIPNSGGGGGGGTTVGNGFGTSGASGTVIIVITLE